MKQMINNRYLLIMLALFFPMWAQAQSVFESTTTWHNQAHAGWKIEPQNYQGYAIIGNRYFSSPNTQVYFSSFDEFGIFNSTKTHQTDFSNLSTFWKNFCSSSFPTGYFVVESGTRNGQWNYYTLMLNQTGHKMWERFGPLGNGVEYTSVCQAVNGGYMAAGHNSNGAIVSLFNAYGELQWTTQLSGVATPWSIKPANGGGYVLAGSLQITRIDADGSMIWNTTLSPSSANGIYTYSEFEEINIINPNNTNLGFIVTGSMFANNYVGIYTARINWNGTVAWLKINDEVNFNAAGTPVTWVNNALITPGGQVFTSWRRGPVSTGGPMYGQFMNMLTGTQGGQVPLNNTIMVREAFASNAHQRLIIGGTRGNLSAVYAYANMSLLLGTAPQQPGVDEANLPNLPTALGSQANFSNHKPEFRKIYDNSSAEFNPASRVFYTDLRVFPNPSTGRINVGGMTESGAMLRVLDMNGRVIAEKQVSEGNELLEFDLSGQSKGLYTVQMIGANQTVVKKVVVE
ncbi:MAG: T9SS type A sorting domain-containing protein [Saprospiraceae bacterium]|nr:T9SS type A sorting domain-containing protein [Saprospiraceae bacterium]